MAQRDVRTRYFLLMHVVENLPPGIDKGKLRTNARQAWRDEAQIMDDLFLIENARRNASEIFCGAHVIIADSAAFYHSWTKLPTAHTRISSHKSDVQQYGVNGQCCHTILFGMIGKDTWLQMENNPCDEIYHVYDFIAYKATGKNQGPYGSSKHTDSFPLRIKRT